MLFGKKKTYESNQIDYYFFNIIYRAFRETNYYRKKYNSMSSLRDLSQFEYKYNLID